MKQLNQSPVLEETNSIDHKPITLWKKKAITFRIIVLIIFLILGFAWYKGYSSREDEIAKLKQIIKEYEETPLVVDPITPVIDLKVLDSEIKAIGELATMEYMYTNAAKFSDSRQFFRWNIPFTQKAFVTKWDGVIKAGIDVQKIEITLKEETKLILIHLPKAEILSHDPDRNSVEVLDEKNGLFNQVKVEDQVKFDLACEEEMNQRAIDNGLLEKAEENAKNIILKILNALPGIEDVYTIEFVVG